MGYYWWSIMNVDWKRVVLLLDAAVAKESTRTKIKV
jgi:hypothetical protein